MGKKFCMHLRVTLGLVALLCAALCGCTQAANTDAPDSQNAEVRTEDSAGDSSASPEKSKGAPSAEANRELTLDDVPSEALISLDELLALMESDDEPFVLDIRAAMLYRAGHIPPAKNIPAGRQIEIRFDEVPVDRTVVLVSVENDRLAETWQTLVDGGVDGAMLKMLDGGMEAWNAAGLDVKVEPKMGC